MQMAHNVSSKRANIFLAVEGTLLVFHGKSSVVLFGSSHKRGSDWPQSPEVPAPPPEEFHLC